MKVRSIAFAVATCVWLVGVNAVAGQGTDRRDSAKLSEQAVVLKQDMRKLWTDHVVWTRDYIIAALADAPEAPTVSVDHKSIIQISPLISASTSSI
jgi:hypothetical protein